MSDDGPRIFVNIEDYVYYNGGKKINTPFKAAAAYMRSAPACGGGGLNGTGARLHWGKAGERRERGEGREGPGMPWGNAGEGGRGTRLYGGNAGGGGRGTRLHWGNAGAVE